MCMDTEPKPTPLHTLHWFNPSYYPLDVAWCVSMADGAVPIGPMDKELTPCPTNSKVATSRVGVLTRWIVLVAVMTVLVLDLAGVVRVPTDDLLGLLLYVL